jgi:hypothetical protein
MCVDVHRETTDVLFRSVLLCFFGGSEMGFVEVGCNTRMQRGLGIPCGSEHRFVGWVTVACKTQCSGKWAVGLLFAESATVLLHGALACFVPLAYLCVLRWASTDFIYFAIRCRDRNRFLFCTSRLSVCATVGLY